VIPLRWLPNGELDPQWYGEVHQDAFAYEQCGRKNSGTFLDLGCWEPVNSSNSLALERLGWCGVLVDSDEKYTDMQREYKRKSPIILARAEDVDWRAVCAQYGLGPVIDYLSLDVEGSELLMLQQFAALGLSFRVITCEHNAHNGGTYLIDRQKQREFLFSQGYTLAIPDVQNSTGLVFEDWWTKF
jgi:hypothetical protein